MQRTPLARAARGIGYSIRTASPDFTDLPAKLDEAEGLQVDFVELPAFAWTLVAGGRVLDDRLQRLVRATRERPFGYTVHGPLTINLMETPSRVGWHLDLLLATINVAAALQAEHLVIHTGCVRDPDETFAVAYSRQRDALQRAGDAAARAGLTLCVENIFRFASMRETASPSRLAGEIDAIAHPHVRATLDVSHAFLRCADGKLDPLAEIAALAPYARHLHVHDSFARPAASWAMDEAERLGLGEGDLHLPIGWGSLPWDRIRASLAPEAGVIVNLELHARYWSELPDQIHLLRQFAGRPPLTNAA